MPKNFLETNENQDVKTYLDNLNFIQNFNANATQFILSDSPLALLSNEEYQQKMCGYIRPPSDFFYTMDSQKFTAKSYRPQGFLDFGKIITTLLFDGSDVDDNSNNSKGMDWRNIGAVSPVRDQGQCGSCWALSAASCYESHYYIANNHKTQSVAPQQLIDCTERGTKGCRGGWMESAYQYMIENKGVNSEEIYPYKAEQGVNCLYDKNSSFGYPKKYVNVDNNEDALMNALSKCGPISVAVDAAPKTFQNYGRGIYKDKSCSKKTPNHAVLLIGYGTENGQDFWTIKNSWGTSVIFI